MVFQLKYNEFIKIKSRMRQHSTFYIFIDLTENQKTEAQSRHVSSCGVAESGEEPHNILECPHEQNIDVS